MLKINTFIFYCENMSLLYRILIADAIEVPFRYKIISDKCVVVDAIEVVTNTLYTTL